MSSIERTGSGNMERSYSGAIVFNPDVGDFVRIGGGVYRIDTLQKVINEAESLKVNPRVGEISEQFRANPANRRFKGSYTEAVASDLARAIRPEFGYNASQAIKAAEAAIALLVDYHDTQHGVYEQRDAARETRDSFARRIDALTADKIQSQNAATRAQEEVRRFARTLQQLKAHLIEVGRTPS